MPVLRYSFEGFGDFLSTVEKEGKQAQICAQGRQKGPRFLDSLYWADEYVLTEVNVP